MPFKRKISVEVTLKESDKRFRVENLRIAFNCARTFTPTANICDVKIYNLSDYTRGLFHELGDQITLNTGYETDEGEQVLFVANTQRVYHQFNVPDVVTTIEGLDADLTFSLRMIQGCFETEISALQVLKNITNQMEIKTLNLASNIQDQSYKQGFSYSGPAASVLTKVCDYMNAEWSIQNKILYVTKKGEPITEPVINLSAETGMIYFPEILRDLPLRFDPLTSQKRIGWRVRSLLNPRIKPRSRVQIYSSKTPELNGIYTVQSVRHIGDSHGNQWETVAEMTR